MLVMEMSEVWKDKEEVVKLRNADSLEDVKVFAVLETNLDQNGLEYCKLSLYIKADEDRGIIKELRNAHHELFGEKLVKHWGVESEEHKGYRVREKTFCEYTQKLGYNQAKDELEDIKEELQTILEENKEKRKHVEAHKKEKYILY